MTATLTLTTWNVQNLFRPEDTDAEAREAYQAKLAVLAEVIRELDPDVIGLQEVGSEESLADLRAAVGGDSWNQHLGTPDVRGIRCAVLSKLPFDETDEIVEFPKSVRALHLTDPDGDPLVKIGRGAPRVRVTKNGFTTDIVSIHLKSKLLTFPGGRFAPDNETERSQFAALALLRRTAEAATIRLAANGLVGRNNSRGLAVLGDFNDSPAAATTQIFQGPDGSELDTRGFDRPDDGDGVRLWNLAPQIPAARRFSRIHRGQGELLDQIFVSHEYFPRGDDKSRRIPLSVDSRVENIRSIGDNPLAPANNRPFPDHAPVTAVFELP